MGEKRDKTLWHEADTSDAAMDSEDAAAAADGSAANGGQPPAKETLLSASMAARQMDRWLASMERLGLADYVRYVDDRKRLFWSNFWGGVARGVGMAVGFTILGAVLVLILQNLARHNLPVIGDFLADIVNVVQTSMK